MWQNLENLKSGRWYAVSMMCERIAADRSHRYVSGFGGKTWLGVLRRHLSSSVRQLRVRLVCCGFQGEIDFNKQLSMKFKRFCLVRRPNEKGAWKVSSSLFG
jgi:hypothetical protein